MHDEEVGEDYEEGHMAMEYMRQQQQNRQGNYSDDDYSVGHNNSF